MDNVKHIGMDVHKEAIFARSTCAYLLEKTNSYALRSRNIARVPQTLFFGSTAGFPPSCSWLQQSQLRHLGLHKPGITIHSLDGSQSSI